MGMRPFLYSFNGGEVSPRFGGRADHQRYFASLAICENFTINAIGNADRRPGLRFVSPVKDHTRLVRLVPFTFSVTQAYAVELGHQYVRFYKARQRVEAPPGNPIEVASPYHESDLFSLQYTQRHDVQWHAHQAYAPRKLLRFSDTQWQLSEIPFDPPPSVEESIIGGVTLNLSATSGPVVLCGATAAVFLDGDVGRELSLLPSEGTLARATVTALMAPAPTAQVILNVLTPFPSTAIPAGTWQLDGPLGCGIHISAGTGLRGTLLKATLRQRDINRPELITNGSFAAGLTGWTNHSGVPLASGTHTGGTGTNLQDTSQHFPALGVRVGMRVLNVTDGTSSTISAITPDGHSLSTPSPGINFDSGDSYEVRGSGGVEIASGGAQLSGGQAGTGWIEQGITTVPGETYHVQLTVEEGPVSVQVGSQSRATDAYAEASFPIGTDQEVIFVAFNTTSYIQIRNNQPTMSRVKNVRTQGISALGFRPEDIGSLIKVRNGVLQIAGLDNHHSANVLVRTPVDAPPESDVIAGAWTLEVPAWSDTRGYPRAVRFHQQRLAYAATPLQPLTVWQSELGDYERFGASALADSALEHEFSIENSILWMQSFRDLLIGTEEGEHILHGVNGPLTPTNGEQLPQSSVGSHGLPPLRLDNSLILLERGGRTIVDILYDENGAVVKSRAHTLIADHITAGGIVQWAVQKQPVPTIWAVRGDGVLIGLTYESFEDVHGWHRHTTDGLFESVCVVPVTNPTDAHTEDVYVSVWRLFLGGPVPQGRRSIEVMDHTLTLDGAVSYAGPPTTTITGLSHLEGATVLIVDKSAGANKPAVLQPREVIGGQVDGLEVAVTACDVGLAAPTPTLRPMRPELPQRDGTIQGHPKKWHQVQARALQTAGLHINGHEAIYRVPEDAMDEGLVLRDGDFEVKDLGWSVDGYLTFTLPDPLPCTLVAAYGELEIGKD